MHSLHPPRSSAADRKPATRPRQPVAGLRPARSPRQFAGGAGASREGPVPAAPSLVAPAPAADGLPAALQMAMEAMSGFSLADVVVHRNSAEPACLGALAFTKGNQIHVAPGQERHLPHEAWHVVQQKQGRVRPTLQMKDGGPVNDDSALEQEADLLGAKALGGELHACVPQEGETGPAAARAARPMSGPGAQPVQRKIADDLRALRREDILVTLGDRAGAAKLIRDADTAGVVIVAAGHGGPQTAREAGTGRILVSIPTEADAVSAARAFVFELQNALRQDRFEALRDQSRTGQIADEDEFARKKMQIEVEGMVETGRIGSKLVLPGGAITSDKFFIPDYMASRHYLAANPITGSSAEFSAQYADSVLDRPHAQGSHREVYAEQFRADANPDNQAARAANDRQRKLASQVRAMSAFIGRDQAVQKLWRDQKAHVPELFDYLTRQVDSAPNAELRADLVRGLAPWLNAAPGDEQDQFISRNPDLMKALYAWLEANDDGQYRSLTQVVGISLGYHEDHPERLVHTLYP